MRLRAIVLARAGAAQAGAAAILGAGEFQVLAHDPKQRRVRLGLDAHRLAVDCKCDRRHGFPPWQTVHPTSDIFRLNRGMVVVCWIGRKARIRGAAPWRAFLRWRASSGQQATRARERSMIPSRRAESKKGSMIRWLGKAISQAISLTTTCANGWRWPSASARSAPSKEQTARRTSGLPPRSE